MDIRESIPGLSHFPLSPFCAVNGILCLGRIVLEEADTSSMSHSVSSAYWDPSGRRIVSTSYDNRLRGVSS